MIKLLFKKKVSFLSLVKESAALWAGLSPLTLASGGGEGRGPSGAPAPPPQVLTCVTLATAPRPTSAGARRPLGARGRRAAGGGAAPGLRSRRIKLDLQTCVI